MPYNTFQGSMEMCTFLMKVCVGVGEPAENLPMPMPHTALGRNYAHDTEAMSNGGTPSSL